MNRTPHILLTVTLLLLLPVSVLALNQGEKIPLFAAKDMNGTMIELSAIIGKKPVMLIFWASWCPNCIREVPKINTLVKKYRGQGMEFIGINVGYNDSEKKARRFMDKTEMAYPVIFDNEGAISSQYSIQGVPTIVIADKKGIVVFKNYAVPEISDEYFQLLNQ